jgi:hypothetical protein
LISDRLQAEEQFENAARLLAHQWEIEERWKA